MGRDSVASTAYAELRAAIATGRFSAGAVLSESRIAAELDISRTPVRQALRRLDLEGHIERDGRGRPIIHVLTPRELAEIFQVRALLEGFGSRLAATRISDAELDRLADIIDLDWAAWRASDVEALARLNREFHGLVMEASRNSTLVEIVDELQWRVFGLGAFAVGTKLDRHHFVSEHAQMLDLLREGDARGLEELVHRHLRTAHGVLRSETESESARHDRSDDDELRIA